MRQSLNLFNNIKLARIRITVVLTEEIIKKYKNI